MGRASRVGIPEAASPGAKRTPSGSCGPRGWRTGRSAGTTAFIISLPTFIVTPEVYTHAAGLLVFSAVVGRQIRRRRHCPQRAGSPA